jgi:general secretion pathway protein D
MRRHPVHRSGPLVAALALVAALLVACNVIPVVPDGTAQEDSGTLDVFEKIRSIDLTPRFPSQVPSADASAGKRVKPAVYQGSDQPLVVGAARPQPTASGDGYDLNFESTPVASVAKVVLGDILGVGYIIDPRVQGTVSLASGRPVPKYNIVFVLENALRLSGVALIRDDVGYRLMPQVDAVGAGGVDTASHTEPGYGISVVPLQYVSAPTLIKLMDSFVTKPGMVRADAGRNMILIQGSSSERRSAIDLVLSFDADWMRGQSVGIFPVQNSNPEPIIAELEKIMDSGEGGLTQNVVRFQKIERMNAVLAVTRKPEVLRTVETWIHRLDNADTARSGVHVYNLKYGEARQVAGVLNSMFGSGGGGSASSLDSAANQLAPGSGLSPSSSAASSSSRLSAAGTSPSSSGGLGSQSSGSGFGGSSSSGNSGVGGGAQSGLGLTGNSQSGAGLLGSSGGGGGGTAILQGVRITPDTVNNTLLIYASQENYSIIERTLRQIDRPQLQVGIDATIAEVTLNDNLNYGVQFFLASNNLGLPADKGSVLNTTANQSPSVASTAGSVAGAFINRAFPGFNFLIGSEAQPNAILSALHAVTDVKVLSNPSLVVIDNQVATLQVGDEVPVSTGSATVLTTNNTVVNTIDYRATGIILRVVPRVSANGNVRLDIEQEISNVPAASVNSQTPTISERKVKSSISVASGQTVLLAGLISEQQSGGRSGIPILEQIPGLGEAFSNTTKAITRTELIIFIRPQIIRDSVDAHFVAEELRTKLRGTIGAAGAGPSAAPKLR